LEGGGKQKGAEKSGERVEKKNRWRMGPSWPLKGGGLHKIGAVLVGGKRTGGIDKAREKGQVLDTEEARRKRKWLECWNPRRPKDLCTM